MQIKSSHQLALLQGLETLSDLVLRFLPESPVNGAPEATGPYSRAPDTGLPLAWEPSTGSSSLCLSSPSPPITSQPWFSWDCGSFSFCTTPPPHRTYSKTWYFIGMVLGPSQHLDHKVHGKGPSLPLRIIYPNWGQAHCRH